MSIFASQTKATLAIPFDAPNTISIRKLTGREVEQAQEAHALGMSTGGRSRLWGAKLRGILEGAVTDKVTVQDAIADPLLGFDRFVVIRCGLLSWTYPESVKPVPAREAVAAKDGHPAIAAVEARDAIADLDDESAEFIAREILRLTKPALFQTQVQSEESAKND